MRPRQGLLLQEPGANWVLIAESDGDRYNQAVLMPGRGPGPNAIDYDLDSEALL